MGKRCGTRFLGEVGGFPLSHELPRQQLLGGSIFVASGSCSLGQPPSQRDKLQLTSSGG